MTNSAALASGTPTHGTVTFYTNTVALGAPVSLSGGVAVSAALQQYVAAATYTVTAVYNGSRDYVAASNTLSEVVQPAVLTPTVTVQGSKVYDGTPAATITSRSVAGVLNGDPVSLGVSGSASYADANVGTGKPVTITGLALSGAAGDYVLSTNTLNVTADITADVVTIVSGVTGLDKFYDGTNTASLAITNPVVLAGLMGGDGSTVTLATNGYAATFATANEGTNIPVTVSGLTLTGGDYTNYSLTQPLFTNAINPATVTITSGLSVDSVIYGTLTGSAATLDSNNVVLTGLIGPDTGSVALSTNGYAATYADTNANAEVAVTVGGLTLTGGDYTNYTLTQPALEGTITLANSGVAVSSTDPSVFGQSGVAFTAVVTNATEGSTGTPTGTVQFEINGTIFGSAVALSGGSATSGNLRKYLPTGTYVVTAVYSGSTNFNPSTGTLNGGQVVNLAASSTTVTSSSLTSVFGQSNVTFSATVADSSVNSSGTPRTGTVQFYTNTVAFGSPVSLVSGSASSAVLPAYLPVGSYTVAAAYTGDANFEGSSGTLTQTVSQASSGATLVSASNPSVFGQSNVTFTVSVTNSAAWASGVPRQGTVQFYTNTVAFGAPVNLVSGGATSGVLPPYLPATTYAVKAVYSGDANYLGVTNTLTQTVAPAASSLALVSSSPTSANGQSNVTFTATVASSSPLAGGTPRGGTVQFYTNTVAFGGAVGLTAGHAVSIAWPPYLLAGAYTVQAVYSGDANYTASSNSLTQTVGPASSGLALTSAANPSVYGQSNVTFTATVTNISAGVNGVANGGTVQFYTNAVAFSSAVLLTNGLATSLALPAGLPTNTYLVTAVYSGNAYYVGSSNLLTQTINQAGSAVVVVSSTNPSVYEQDRVTFTVTVTNSLAGAGGIPTGKVRFTINGVNFGSALTLSHGSASSGALPISDTPGNYVVSATYTGDANFSAGSGTLGNGQTVQHVAAATTVVSSSPTSLYGQTNVTFTATVAGPVGTPTGTVQFLTNGVGFGPLVTLANGSAVSRTLPVTLAPNSYTVAAAYSGDNLYATNQSANFTQTIIQATLTPSVTVQSTKPYDGTTAAAITGRRLSGFVAGDTFHTVHLGESGTATYADANVGTGKLVTVTGLSLSGASAADYVLSTNTVTTTANITPLGGVTVVSGLTALDKVYDGTNTASLSITNPVVLAGLLGGDGAHVTLATNGYAAAFVTVNATSNITVTVSGLTLTGGDATNYTLTQPLFTNTITPAPVTVASGLTVAPVVYGTLVPPEAATLVTNDVVLAGVLAADTGSVGLVTNGYGATFTATNAGLAVPVTVTGLSLAGGDYTNYTLSQPALTGAITLANSAVVVVSALNPSVYGQGGVTFTATVTDGSVGSGGVPTGTVQFATNGVDFGASVTLASGSASSILLPAGLPVGTYAVTAAYSGDTNFDAAGGTLSGGQTVNHAAESVYGFSEISGPNGTNGDGAYPYGTVVGDRLYGTTDGGGSAGKGTVFAINDDGTSFTNLYNFTGGGDGANPQAALVFAGGILYGTTSSGGTNDTGALFAISTNGTGFTKLYSFSATTGPNATNGDGADPRDSLVVSGNTLYGTTYGGGVYGYGTVFAINTDGTGFTNLYSFTGGSDGGYPQAGLLVSGGVLYGTTTAGGTNNTGAIFAINTDGTGFTRLYSFTATAGPEVANTDGANPLAALLLSDGVLYGTANAGGVYGYGSVFAINPDGAAFTNLYSFANGSDGANPEAALILSGNTLFGTANGGGVFGYGTIFTLNTNGTDFTALYSFAGGADGAYPEAGLVLLGNTVYGTAELGGSAGEGAVFNLVLPEVSATVALVSSANPSVYGQAGVGFTLTASGLRGTPTGTVQFATNGVAFGGAVSLANGGADSPALPVTLLPGGYTLTAVYSGDAAYVPATNTLAQTVNQAGSALGLTSAANPSVYGQSNVTFTATVSDSSAGSSGTPAGTVQFELNGVAFGGAVTLAGGVATSPALPVTQAVAGYTVTAAYSGSAAFTGVTNTLSQTINPAGSSLALNSSANPSVYGQSNVTFTVTVSNLSAGSGGVPDGTVQFLTNGVAFGAAVTLSAGSAGSPVLPVSLPVAGYTVTAAYTGSAAFTGSTNTLTQTINPAGSIVTVVSSANPSLHGQAGVTLTATVTDGSAGSGVTPTGTVQFELNGSDFGAAVTLVGGSATSLALPTTLPTGTYTITAVYGGSPGFHIGSATLSGGQVVLGHPQFTGISVNGTTLTLTAINGAPNGTFVLLQSTNLLLPPAQWTPVLTNTFNGGGNLNLSTNIVNPAGPGEFYLLSQ